MSLKQMKWNENSVKLIVSLVYASMFYVLFKFFVALGKINKYIDCPMITQA